MTAERNFPIIPEVSRSVQNEFRTLRNMLYDAQDALTAIKPQPGAAGATGAQGAPGTTTIIQSGSSATLATPQMANVTQILGILAQAQRSYIPAYTSLPSLQDPASQNGSLISVNGILYRFNGSPQPGQWLPQEAVATVLFDTRANRIANYPPANYVPGTILFETDSTLFYIIQIVSSVNKWVWCSGEYARTQAQLAALAATLTTTDTGLLVNVTDYAHILQWSGSAWTWGPGESGSGYFQDFAIAPTGSGWHACDGSTGIKYLKADGTTGTITVPNTASTPAYRKSASTYSATISSAATPTVTIGAITPGGTISAPTLTMNSYTPAGSVTGAVGTPTFTGTPAALTTNLFTPAALATPALTSLAGSTSSYTPSGSISTPPFVGSFSGTPATLTGTVSAPTFTGNSVTPTGTISLAAGDPVANYQAITYFRM
jgi:hypothetical protein